MKKIYTAADLPEAHLISYELRQAGIAHHIFNQNLQGGVGELPFTHTYPEIWVIDESQAVQAREVIRAFELSPKSVGLVICPHCREENPDTFEICWHCGRHLD